ncbi:MAG: hypothetical protein ACP5GX_07245, partial [Anaerolineae bacterium]
MLIAPFLQQNAWRFDWRSALIGAIAAWLLAALLYRYRETLKNQVKRLWAPIVQWRDRMRRSTEEKYLEALQDALRTLLLFEPQNPESVFVPPLFLAPQPPALNLTEEGEESTPRRVTFKGLLKGHPRVLLTGVKGDGRTTSLAMMTWVVATEEDEGPPYERFPLWIDLARLSAPPEDDSPPLEALTELATRFLPRAVPKWLLEQLQNQPSIILVDNWDQLPPDERIAVARWIATVADTLTESIWLVTTGPHGYGPLVEAEFVPVETVPQTEEDALYTVYHGWASLLGREAEDLRGEAFFTLLWALQAGDRLL